jgi:hypothetical protein
MRTTDPIFERMITRNVSNSPVELPERITNPFTAPAELPERIANPFTPPAELPERITDPLPAPEEPPEKIAGRSSSRAEPSEKITGRTCASEKPPGTAELSLKQSGHLFEQAYQSLLPKMLSLRASDIVPININVLDAVSKGLGIESRLAGLNDRIRETLPTVDAHLFEHLTTHAFALSHADTLFSMASQALDVLPSLAAEGKALRAVLLADAQALIRRGLIDGAPLHGLKPDMGYANLARDLQILAQLFRRSTGLSGLTAVRPEDIQRAQEIAMIILTRFKGRKDLRASIEKAMDIRQRAFTLFVRLYEETRRVVLFLRYYERDADELVPRLHAKNKNRKKHSGETTQTQETQDVMFPNVVCNRARADHESNCDPP